MMTLVDAVVWAFDELGGDPSRAAEAAFGHSYNSWVNQQAAYAAGSGAVAMAVPAYHLLALVADLSILMHKMAYCAWGVGTICGCAPAGKEDLQIILALWSGALSPEELFGVGGGTAIAGGTLTTTMLGTNHAVGKAVSKGMPKAVAKGLPKAVGKGAGLATGAAVGAVVKKLPAAAVVTQFSSQAASLWAAKLSEKLAAKIAAKIGTKVTANGVAGFIPVVGAAAGASVPPVN